MLIVLTLFALGCGSKPESVRFATFNSALSRDAPGELLEALSTPNDEQAKAVSAVIQAARPDVLLLQEFDHGGDYDPDGKALQHFQQNYLGVSQSEGLEPIAYEHVYLAPSNTGLPTGVDLNGDGLVAPCEGTEVGTSAYAADCHGWGLFPGQYAFAVLSKYPIDEDGIRTFQEFLWKDLPGNHLPPGYYSDEALAVLRLSSKNHVDVPIDVGGETPIHVLAAHPTPPVFDGPENRNGLRNEDETSLLPLYVEAGRPTPFDALSVGEDPSPDSRGAEDDRRRQRLPFVICGDMNADPRDGDDLANNPETDNVVRPSRSGWDTYLDLSDGTFPTFGVPSTEPETRTTGFMPVSTGAQAATERDSGVNADHYGDPAADTADWDDSPGGPGNLRVDYVLPSSDLDVLGGGVFWPTADEPLRGVDLATVERASDHRLVWVDVRQR